MTVHLISVGRSILDTFDRPRSRVDNPDLVRMLKDARPGELLAEVRDGADADAWVARATDPVRGVPALTEAIARAAPGTWPARVSAELDTLHHEGAYPLSGTDIAVLICSDTPDGLLSALWNAVALTTGGPDPRPMDRIGYLADPGSPLGTVRGRALIVRMPGLDIGDEKSFTQSMRGLGTLAGHLVAHPEVPEEEPAVCHLSGGYKATIPYLIGLAEAIRSLPGTRQVEALVLHEAASTTVRLPLRRIAPELIACELKGFDEHGRCATRPYSTYLDGYAYRQDDESAPWSPWTLTAFGHGLRALFGIAYPGLLS